MLSFCGLLLKALCRPIYVFPFSRNCDFALKFGGKKYIGLHMIMRTVKPTKVFLLVETKTVHQAVTVDKEDTRRLVALPFEHIC